MWAARDIFTAGFENVAVTAAQDFMEISPASNKPCLMLGVLLAQSSDVKDAEEEILRVSIIRVPATATSGSGGTAPTPRLTRATGAAAGFAAEVNNTTIATTSGTLETLANIPFNIRVGQLFPFPPEWGLEFVNGTLGVVRLNAAPADSLTMHGTLWVRELG